MKIVGQLCVLIGMCLPIITTATSTLANEEDCAFKALITVKKFATTKQFERLPNNAVLKVQVIEAALLDADAPVIADGNVDVSDYYFPLKFNMSLDCEKLKRTIMPSFNIRVELDDKLLFINDSMHPYSRGEVLQKIELKKIH